MSRLFAAQRSWCRSISSTTDPAAWLSSCRSRPPGTACEAMSNLSQATANWIAPRMPAATNCGSSPSSDCHLAKECLVQDGCKTLTKRCGLCSICESGQGSFSRSAQSSRLDIMWLIGKTVTWSNGGNPGRTPAPGDCRCDSTRTCNAPTPSSPSVTPAPAMDQVSQADALVQYLRSSHSGRVVRLQTSAISAAPALRAPPAKPSL